MLDNPKINQLILYTGFFLIIINFFLWAVLPPWIHFEVYQTVPGYLLEDNESFFKNFFQKVFNLNTTELGYYRPRVLSFILQYMDANIGRALYKNFSVLGLKFPGYFISLISLVASVIYFWRTIFPKSSLGFCLIAASGFMNFEIYLNTSAQVLRSGKLLTPAIGIFFIAFFLKYCRKEIPLNTQSIMKSTGIAFTLFILSTTDEQLIILLFFLMCCSVLHTIAFRKNYRITVMLMASVVLYLIYYLVIGRLLFNYYTPGGVIFKHPHGFQDAIKFNFNVLYHALEMLMSNLITLSYSLIIFSSSLIYTIILLTKSYKMTKRPRPEQICILLGFIIFPILLVSGMITSHPPIYKYPTLWFIFYLPLPVFILFMGLPYIVSLINYENRIPEYLLLFGLFVVSISGISMIEKHYQEFCVKYSNDFSYNPTTFCDPTFPIFMKYNATLEQGIDFSKSKLPSFVSSIKGLSYDVKGSPSSNPFFRLSDAKLEPTIKINLSKNLPNKFILTIIAGAYGPNANGPTLVKIGNQIQSVMITNEIKEYSLHFDLSNKPNKQIEIIPYQPTSPLTMGEGYNTRLVGLAIAKIMFQDLATRANAL